MTTRTIRNPMTYRAPGKDPLTDWGRFLVRRRKDLDWSATQAFEAVREGLRLGVKSRSAYLPFEYDREPDDAEAALFEQVFGGLPGEQDRRAVAPPAPSDLGALVEAINALVAEMSLARREQAQWNKGVEETLAAVLQGRIPGAPTADREPRLPAGARQ